MLHETWSCTTLCGPLPTSGLTVFGGRISSGLTSSLTEAYPDEEMSESCRNSNTNDAAAAGAGTPPPTTRHSRAAKAHSNNTIVQYAGHQPTGLHAHSHLCWLLVRLRLGRFAWDFRRRSRDGHDHLRGACDPQGLPLDRPRYRTNTNHVPLLLIPVSTVLIPASTIQLFVFSESACCRVFCLYRREMSPMLLLPLM